MLYRSNSLSIFDFSCALLSNSVTFFLQVLDFKFILSNALCQFINFLSLSAIKFHQFFSRKVRFSPTTHDIFQIILLSIFGYSIAFSVEASSLSLLPVSYFMKLSRLKFESVKYRVSFVSNSWIWSTVKNQIPSIFLCKSLSLSHVACVIQLRLSIFDFSIVLLRNYVRNIFFSDKMYFVKFCMSSSG